MNLRLIQGPTLEPISLYDRSAQEFLRLDGTISDNNMIQLLKSAREAAEAYQNRSYMTQVWELSFDCFPHLPMRLPKPPLKEVLAIKYYTSDEIEHNLEPRDFIIDVSSEPGRVAFKAGMSWPQVRLRSIDAVKIQFKAGHDAADDVSHMVKNAILVHALHRFENPDNGDVPQAFYNLLKADRVVPI